MYGSLISLGIVLLAAGMLTCAAASLLMALGLLRPPRMTDGKALYVLRRLSPADLGLGFEDVGYVIRDARSGQPLRIAGWWIPAAEESGRSVVLLHGYADAKVGSIAWAPLWHQLGYHVLVIDLRAHGESDGKYATGGYWEQHDVSQVIDQFRAERPVETAKLALFGVSMGAAVAAGVAAERDDLAAVVLDSPFADFRTAAAAHFERLGLPGAWLGRGAFSLAEWLSGARFADVRPVDAIRKIACPLMMILTAEDAYLDPTDAAELERAVESRPAGAGPGVCWRPHGSMHGMAAVDDPDAYQRNVAAFLQASELRHSV